VTLCCLGAAVVSLAAEPGGAPDPAVKKWPHWPGRVSCGRLAFKPLIAFARPTGAELGARPSEVALREFLAEGELSSLGVRTHGWRLLAETPAYAEFEHGRLSTHGGATEMMAFAHRRKGWRWVGYSGGCEPRVLRHREWAITWTLAPDQPLRPSTRTIEVNLGPGECDSGRSQNKRLERPRFREENGALLMALWLRPVHGGQTCQALIEPPVKIRLPHRLGHLELLDGGVFPPSLPVERE
jgi:hypothetical protein